MAAQKTKLNLIGMIQAASVIANKWKGAAGDGSISGTELIELLTLAITTYEEITGEQIALVVKAPPSA